MHSATTWLLSMVSNPSSASTAAIPLTTTNSSQVGVLYDASQHAKLSVSEIKARTGREREKLFSSVIIHIEKQPD